MRQQTSPRQTGPSGDDNTAFYLVVIVAGLCSLSYMMWSNFHGEIRAGVMALYHHEIIATSIFTDCFGDLAAGN